MIQYLFGDDTFTARKNIHDQAVTSSAAIRWVDKEEGENASLEELFDSGKGSLLGSMVVVIQDPSLYPEEVRERILAACEGSYSGNVILWDRNVDKRLAFHKKVKGMVASKEMQQPKTEDDMGRWISSYAPDIPVDAVRELVLRVGCDIWSATNEIDKLRTLPVPIQASDVARLVAQRDTSYSSAFPLLDAIIRKQKTTAVRMLNEMLLSGASERFILAMLAYQFRLFLGVKIGKERGESVLGIEAKTDLSYGAIQKGIQAVSRLSVDAISELLQRIAATEKSLVTTTMDPRSIVTMLIIGLCR